jgi:hypothetical protein
MGPFQEVIISYLVSIRKPQFFSSPLMGEGRVGMIIPRDFKTFLLDSSQEENRENALRERRRYSWE